MSAATAEAQKVEELWFEDADIIFQAGKKKFRVHRGILCARSPVFRDMFSVPQPESPVSPETHTETSDTSNCLVIYLPDSENDVHYFFSAIFDASFFEPPPSPVALGIITSILRLSHKYDVGFLKRRAVSHLNLIFTTNMESFFASPTGHPLSDELKVSFLAVIEVACKVSVQWILPSLFFWAAQAPISKVVASDKWRNLDPLLQGAYIFFREKYVQDRETLGRWLLMVPDEECPTPARCMQSSRWYMMNCQWLDSFADTRTLQIPGSPHRRELERKFCKQCARDAINCSSQLIRNRWTHYPALLGISDWKTLEKEKREFAKAN